MLSVHVGATGAQLMLAKEQSPGADKSGLHRGIATYPPETLNSGGGFSCSLGQVEREITGFPPHLSLQEEHE